MTVTMTDRGRGFPGAGPESRDLKNRFIALFREHPIIVLLAVMVIGALVFGDLLT